MKLSRLLFPVLLTITTALTGASFEGKVTLGIKSGKDKEMIVEYTLKEGYARMEPKIDGAEGMGSIMDWKKMEMIMLMGEQRMYMVMPLKGPVAGATEAAGSHDAKVVKTGETETILGYLCEKYVTTDNKDTIEMWVTDKIGTFMGLQSGGGNPMAGMFGGGAKKKGGWEEAVKNKENFFPLRVVGKNAKGKETFRMETKSVEPGSVPASAFTVPDGWQKFQMPNIGDLFKG